MTEHVVQELSPKHPVLAAVIEREHQMDLKATLAALIVVDALKGVRKLSLIGLIISSFLILLRYYKIHKDKYARS